MPAWEEVPHWSRRTDAVDASVLRPDPSPAQAEPGSNVPTATAAAAARSYGVSVHVYTMNRTDSQKPKLGRQLHAHLEQPEP